MDFKGKKVTVAGLARSGVGAANMLAGLGAAVTVTDKKGHEELKGFLAGLDPEVKLALGSHPPDLFEKADLIVVSPGVPLAIAPLRRAAEKGVKIIGELELAFLAADKRAEFLSITGTNGKSTTTMLLYEMIKNNGFNAILGGNIGYALTEEILKSEGGPEIDYLVAEVSSFQLETIDTFRPKGAAILNVTPDHLDRYPSMSDYIDAKCRVFINQGSSDFLVLNADDPLTHEIIKRIKDQRTRAGEVPQIFYFSRKHEVRGAYFKDGLIRFDLPEDKVRHLKTNIQKLPVSDALNPESFRIRGVHNIENAMAASLMALLSGCSIDSVAKTLERFPGLEHRLEFVREMDGVRFINDSKGTNVGAVLKSLESFDSPIILIAGGRDKDSDFTLLRQPVRERVKALILIGEAKDKINKAVGDITTVFMADDLKSAVARAKEAASSGDVVLLSPACASFDMFRDFEDRGEQFKKAVMEL